GFKDVNQVISVDRSRFHSGNPRLIVCDTISLLRRVRVRAERFSLVVDFQGYGETGLLTWLSGAPRRLGTVYKAGRAWAYTDAVPRDFSIHQAAWNLRLLEP